MDDFENISTGNREWNESKQDERVKRIRGNGVRDCKKPVL